MTMRAIDHIIPGVDTSDGAGVRLRRSVGSRPGLYLDPFLMLDEFSSDDAEDYIAGFPPHPHRGFETVTYMLDGHMLHEDHLGNRGELRGGDVQWMTAGRGIVHSEMPQQKAGRMRGFQLWLNLPARDKMQPPRYRDIAAAEIPRAEDDAGNRLALIAGQLEFAGRALRGPVNGLRDMTTDPFYADLALVPGGAVRLPLPAGHTAFAYLFEGAVAIAGQALRGGSAAVLGAGEGVELTAGEDGGRLLLLAGRPLGEPVVQRGPFVMNTREEIEQAMRDYASGALTAG